MQEAFADHLAPVGRVSPQEKHKEEVPLIDNAPWHKGGPINEALAEDPRLAFARLAGHSTRPSPVERPCKG